MALSKHCVVCTAEHQERGWFCSDKCRKEYRNAKRNEKAGKKCRLCGRRLPKPRDSKPEIDAVPREHTVTQESLHV
jgi:hypothetical protein